MSEAEHHVYTHGHADGVLRSHRWRTAENSAAYLLGHIGSDATLLDVGCGPGTITVDFARRARQGRVVGVDRSQAVLSHAAAAARQAGVGNVDFVVGDVYALSYPDDTFDVVHAHQLLHHLSDPVAALREMARVCKPTGVVGVREVDYAAVAWWPEAAELHEWLSLVRQVMIARGGQPDAGRRLKGWALAAGLTLLSSTASVWCYSSGEEVSWWGESWAERVVSSDLTEHAKTLGLARDADLRRLADGWRRWAGAPDAWFALMHGEISASGTSA
ncbi:MAG: class I SAM-dependent methyltransferase [Dermatophilaceae bacterium]